MVTTDTRRGRRRSKPQPTISWSQDGQELRGDIDWKSGHEDEQYDHYVISRSGDGWQVRVYMLFVADKSIDEIICNPGDCLENYFEEHEVGVAQSLEEAKELAQRDVA